MLSTPASRLEQFSVQHYAREVRPHLPAWVFQPVPARLLWLPVHLAVILGAGARTSSTAAPPWYLALGAALIAGHSWACLSFLAHETLHHAVVKNRVVERLVGYCGLGLYCLSPTLWVAWHNQEHHGNTGNPEADPDAYWSLEAWETSAVDRAMTKASPGSGHKRSASFLFVTFSLHSLVVLLVAQPPDTLLRADLAPRGVRRDRPPCWRSGSPCCLLVGAWSFLFIYVLPLFVANAIIMSYIATNHHLNSLTAINDPLANTLSVRSPGWLECASLPVRLPRRAPCLPDRERPPCADRPRRAGAPLRRPLPEPAARARRCASSTRGRSSTPRTTR